MLRSPLDGKVVLITGAARGLGAETARLLAARGARLALVGLEPEALAALAGSLGPEHRWFESDVTDQASLDRAVAGTVEAFGGIDVVVANAGIASQGTVAVTPVEALVRVIDVNLSGVVRTVSATLPHVAARRGYYLLVSSAAAFVTLPGISTYAAAKSGVEQFGNALRLELLHRGVAVGTAHPSWVDTDMVRDAQRDLAAFRTMLPKLPPPFRTVTPVDVCARAFVRGIERRSRRVYVPGSLAAVAMLRHLLASRIGELPVLRHVRRYVPQSEQEARALGRAFGEHSVESQPAPRR